MASLISTDATRFSFSRFSIMPFISTVLTPIQFISTIVFHARISNNAVGLYQIRCHLSRPMPFTSTTLLASEVFNNAIYLYQIFSFDAIYLVGRMPFKSTGTV